MIDFAVSVLPHLEPFAGLTFALNLAYIGLPRFRYRQRIQSHVSEKLKEIDGEPHQFEETEWYKGPARLAALKDDRSDTSDANLPKESWATGYSRIFERHRDRQTCIALSSFAGILLALGSAHSAEHFGSIIGFDLMWLFGDASFEYWFLLLTLCALFPVYMVYRGNMVVVGACDYADTQIRDMKKAKQAKVANLENPPVPQGPPVMNEVSNS